MRITLLVPGTGSFYCGSCLRDHALAVALRGLGHDVEVVPLYLPLFVEDPNVDPSQPVHMGGINLYLQQKLPALGAAPRFATKLLDAPGLLRWASARGNMTGAASHAEMALSMMRGEEGRQGREVERLAEWLAAEGAPEVFVLSNAMLLGMARTLERRLGAAIVCTLQGEAPFIDAFPEPLRSEAWRTLAERAAEVDAFVAVSADYGGVMTERLQLDPMRVHVVHNGIPLEGLVTDERPDPDPPVVGYLARMCPDKGLATLVDAFIELHRRGRVPGLRLRAGGVLLAGDRPWLAGLEQRLAAAGLGGHVELLANVDREQKLELLHSLSVLSVPATYGESFGLYVLEALAAGVPVVQPRHGAFPEVLEATGGGLLCEPDDPVSLAEGLEALLLDRERARALGTAGRRAVSEHFTVERMARGVQDVCSRAVSNGV